MTSFGLWTLVVVLLVSIGACLPTSASELANTHFKLRLGTNGLSGLQADPSGRGGASIDFARSLKPENWDPTAETRVSIEKSRASISHFRLWRNCPLAFGDGHEEASLLEASHTFAQTFDIPAGVFFRKASVRLPTWQQKGSGALLSLYCGDRLLGSRRLVNVSDNAWEGITLDEPVGEGRYRLQVSEPKGKVGLWMARKSTLDCGEALVDGKPTGRDFNVTVEARAPIGEGSLHFILTGDKLLVEAEANLEPGVALEELIWQWRTTWKADGYDCTSRAGIVFDRFFSDNQRYMPVQQLKRQVGQLGCPHYSFPRCKWIEMEGTRDADFRLEGGEIGIKWEATPDEMCMQISTPVKLEGNKLKSSFRTVVLPRKASVPEVFPRFACSDPGLTEDINRFWWERGFTYPGPAYPCIIWGEFMSICRSWFAGPARDGEVKLLRDYRLAEDGHVSTSLEVDGWGQPSTAERDTRHYDTNARYILACWRHYLWSGDKEFLRSVAERLRRAMRYQLDNQSGKDGLILAPSSKPGRHEAMGNNYWDILPFGYLDGYSNIVYYASIEAMKQMQAELGDEPMTDYDSLLKKSRQRYNEVFWDDSKGRYIGCVDIDGKRHDYGFTFLNLEAIYHGLADPAKVKRIYEWMETQPTSSGKADTYTKWIFAPRATTMHNPMWGAKAGMEKNADAGVEPWWEFWWYGTPFGDQCQDGGAILYTSFFDLMSRVRYLGAENAWSRFSEILGRYRMPDRLCGGPPLFRGEIPQQVNPGAVGTDLPFPESALVPCYFLFGVLGVEARADGLAIAPRLPKGLSYAEVKGLSWRGNQIDLRVTREQVEIKGVTRDGKRIRKQLSLPSTGEIVISRL